MLLHLLCAIFHLPHSLTEVCRLKTGQGDALGITALNMTIIFLPYFDFISCSFHSCFVCLSNTSTCNVVSLKGTGLFSFTVSVHNPLQLSKE